LKSIMDSSIGNDKEDPKDDNMDYGIMRALHDMMALEIDLTPSIDTSVSSTQVRWQRQYVEYSIKVKELLRKLLRKLENNYQYQRYLEDELKSLEQECPEIGSSETTSATNSLQLSTMIEKVSRLFNTTPSTTELRKRPSIVSQNSPSTTPDEKSAEDLKMGDYDADDNDEILDIRNVGSTDFQDFEEMYRFPRKDTQIRNDLVAKDVDMAGSNESNSSLLKELERVRLENYQLKLENSKIKDLRATEMALISKTMEAFSDRIRILNNHYGE